MFIKYWKKMYELECYNNLLWCFLMVILFCIILIFTGFYVIRDSNEPINLMLSFLFNMVGWGGMIFTIVFPTVYIKPLLSEFYDIKFVDDKIFIKYRKFSFELKNQKRNFLASDFLKDINGNKLSNTLSNQIAEYMNMTYPIELMRLGCNLGGKITPNMVGKEGFSSIRKASQEEIDKYIKNNDKILLEGVIPSELKGRYIIARIIEWIVFSIFFMSIIYLAIEFNYIEMRILLMLVIGVIASFLTGEINKGQREKFKKIMKKIYKHDSEVYIAKCYIATIRQSKDFKKYYESVMITNHFSLKDRILRFANTYKKCCYEQEAMLHDGEGHWIDEWFGLDCEENNIRDSEAQLILVKYKEKVLLDIYTM